MPEQHFAQTGIEGLDQILGSGLPVDRMYLVQGDPGVGKTTMALQFLLAGAARGEPTLYVTLSESAEELRTVAASHGWSLDRIVIYEMYDEEVRSVGDDENTLYVPAEVELGERMEALLAELERVRPRRLVIDSCSELRLLAQTPLRFRRQLLALKRDLVRRGCTLLLLENPSTPQGDVLLQSLVHGVIHMEQSSSLYGCERRRLRVIKMRHVQFRGGYHDLVITTGGVVVFPRLVAAEHRGGFTPAMMASGVGTLDHLLGGGLDLGTSTLVIGPPGTGKSALATRYALAVAERGEHVAFFIFDEGTGTLFQRSAALGMDLRPHVEARRITVRQIDPAEVSPGEFAHILRHAVEHLRARMIVIDSLNGYFNAMPQEQYVLLQLHEILTYLRQQGVVTLLVVAQHGTVGASMAAPIDVSYLADTVVMTRFFEAAGALRKAVSVLKKRGGCHENTIRELSLSGRGLEVGPPLDQFHGILTGVPEWIASSPPERGQ